MCFSPALRVLVLISKAFFQGSLSFKALRGKTDWANLCLVSFLTGGQRSGGGIFPPGKKSRATDLKWDIEGFITHEGENEMKIDRIGKVRQNSHFRREEGVIKNKASLPILSNFAFPYNGASIRPRFPFQGKMRGAKSATSLYSRRAAPSPGNRVIGEKQKKTL